MMVQNHTEMDSNADRTDLVDSVEDADTFFGTFHLADNDESSHQMLPHRTEYNKRKPKWWIRQSKKPSKGQRRAMTEMKHFLLDRPPHGSLLDWPCRFDVDARTSGIWLEIGFGLGDNLLCLAARRKDRCYIGAEVHGAGIGTILQRVQVGLARQQPWSEYTLYASDGEAPPLVEDSGSTAARMRQSATVNNHPVNVPSLYSNLRIWRGDGIGLLQCVAPSSLNAILITFPDPFPSQKQRRVIQTHTVRLMHQALQKQRGGRLFVATDHDGFFAWTREVLAQVPDLFRRIVPCPDRSCWLPVVSKYERKGWTEGRQTKVDCWECL
jgi:tRNA (guanine-N7-)-methyltransferase